MTTLKIYSNHSVLAQELIVQVNNIHLILEEYDIDPQSPNFQELFETELLSDIFEEEGIDSSNVHYELI
tara:strand:+ start:237 stop:443 length:207 start_codon:yes stop_codon:yes gene_type:complete